MQFALKGTIGLALVFGLLAVEADASLIAWYQGEGNANDSAGTHHGTLQGGAGYGSGVFGHAFSLNGSPQRMTAPDDPAWAFGAGAFSMSLWVNFSQIAQGGLGGAPNVFLGQDEGPGPTNKWVFAYDGLGTLYFHINGPGLTFITAPTAINPTVNSWHMYSMTRSGTTYTFYYDGVSLGTANDGLNIPDSASPLEIGEVEGLGWLHANVDDTRIYNHALTSGEVASLVPEPSTFVVIGLAGLGLLLRRRK